VDSPCYLFTSDEIPGPYPDFQKGWGGGNLTGYSNQAFDEMCQAAQSLIPGTESYIQAHHQLQTIFAEDLPVIPLYQRYHIIASRTDMCDFPVEPSANSALNDLETFDYGFSCQTD
jgi:ABC-type transport system substrate-binding protein